MNRWLLLISIACLLLLTSCRDDEVTVLPASEAHGDHGHTHAGHDHAPGGHTHETVGQAQATRHSGTIVEVLQATQYTYLRIQEGGEELWIAIPKQSLAVGQSVSFAGGFEMSNFSSKDLNRTLERVYLVSSISTEGTESTKTSPQGSPPQPHGRPKVEAVGISVEPAAQGISLETLFAHPQDYAGKRITVRGQVTKFNRAIMKKNWIHLSDGTRGASGPYDLTLTTPDAVEVEVGETVTFSGKITLDRDFGYGYVYDVLMEESKRIE